MIDWVVENWAQILQDIGVLIAVLTPIAIWIRSTLRGLVKEEVKKAVAHCCMTNGCLTKLKKAVAHCCIKDKCQKEGAK